MALVISTSCNGSADVPAASSFHTAITGCRATGDLAAVASDQSSGHQCSDYDSSADISLQYYLPVQHICGSSSDSRTLYQSRHCKEAAWSRFLSWLWSRSCNLSPSLDVLWFYDQINAASLGAQPQFLSSLTSTPIITSAMSNMAGITSQIITNAQGQVSATTCLLRHIASGSERTNIEMPL